MLFIEDVLPWGWLSGAGLKIADHRRTTVPHSTGSLTVLRHANGNFVRVPAFEDLRFLSDLAAQSDKSVSRETFWYDGHFAQKHFYDATDGTKPGFGASGHLR
jgi:hypothetical protein